MHINHKIKIAKMENGWVISNKEEPENNSTSRIGMPMPEGCDEKLYTAKTKKEAIKLISSFMDEEDDNKEEEKGMQS